MENCILMRPDKAMAAEIAAYRREFRESGDSMDGTGALSRIEDPCEWVDFCMKLSSEETVPENWVPSMQFMYVRPSDHKIVGMIDIRRRFNDYLRDYGGNIGYSVRPSERKKGYASRMLAGILPICRELGLKKVLITCDADNEASRKTILKNGGVYESTVLEPEENISLERYWITL